jgi:GntR family transcriptional regulator/MocR family aminotransferase
MAVEWTGLGPELLVRLDRQLPEPLGRQLQDQVRQAIRSGRLTAGERLPSSRVLAVGLGLSRGLVIECYRQLESEGYLTTRIGSATRVALDASAPPTPAPGVPVRRPPDVDFRYGVPDLTSFPSGTGSGRSAKPGGPRPRR